MEKKKLFGSLREKIKRVKHLDIILTVLFIAVILLIYFSTTGLWEKKNTSGAKIPFSENVSSLQEYENKINRELTETLSAIHGAGNVKVMLHFTEGLKKEIAYTTEIKTQLDGTKVEVKRPVFTEINGKEEPIVLKEIFPKPESIIVVSTGAKDTNVKLEIIRLVQAIFELNSSKIEVFAGK